VGLSVLPDQLPLAAPGAVTIQVAGEAVVLLPHRAAYWVSQRTLLAADLHLDKCEGMRLSGMPMPEALVAEQIARLDASVRVTGALRVMILGDLLHSPTGLSGRMVEQFGAWRASVSIDLAIVPGNHDRALARVADAWRMTVLAPVHTEGPFVFTHDPIDFAAPLGGYAWAGHVHPAVTLRTAADSLKLPCFHVGRGLGVLPAFSAFTAGGPFQRRAGDRVYGIADGHVLDISNH
jgi:uncharacterized protein